MAETSAVAAWGRAIRPRQWVKNLLVFAAPGSAGILFESAVFTRTLLAFLLFSVAASGTYLINDVIDVEADRRHPKKRVRPIASGNIAPRTALVVGVVAMMAALAGGFAIRPALGSVITVYLITTLAYSVRLKHLPVIDIVTIAAGFVMRALAGAAAADVAISNWFFVVTTFGSLFMITGKRYCELGERAQGAVGTRAVLDNYSTDFLRYVLAVSSGAAILAYSLWAFERAAEAATDVPWFQLSIVPFTTGFLYYALLVDQGEGGAPEDLAFTDRTLQSVGASWLALFAIGLASVT